MSNYKKFLAEFDLPEDTEPEEALKYIETYGDGSICCLHCIYKDSEDLTKCKNYGCKSGIKQWMSK